MCEGWRSQAKWLLEAGVLNDDQDLKDQIAFDGGDFERLMVSNVFFPSILPSRQQKNMNLSRPRRPRWLSLKDFVRVNIFNNTEE